MSMRDDAFVRENKTLDSVVCEEAESCEASASSLSSVHFHSSFFKDFWHFRGTRRFYGSMALTFAYWFCVYAIYDRYDLSNDFLCLFLMIGVVFWACFVIFGDRSAYKFCFSRDTIASLFRNRALFLLFLFMHFFVPLMIIDRGFNDVFFHFERIFMVPFVLLFFELSLFRERHKILCKSSIAKTLRPTREREELLKKPKYFGFCPREQKTKSFQLRLPKHSFLTDEISTNVAPVASSLPQEALQSLEHSKDLKQDSSGDSRDISSSSDLSTICEETVTISESSHKEGKA